MNRCHQRPSHASQLNAFLGVLRGLGLETGVGGKPARSTLRVASLPKGVKVEIKLVAEVWKLTTKATKGPSMLLCLDAMVVKQFSWSLSSPTSSPIR